MKIYRGMVFFFLLFMLSFPAWTTEKKEFSLPEIIDLALENNPLLSAKKNEVKAREASYEAAKRLSNPELEFSVGRGKSWDEDIQRNTGGILLSQYLENPFKRHYRIQVYAKDWEAAEFSHTILALDVTFMIKNFYYDILRQKSRQELARKTLDSVKKIHRLIEKRAKLGEIKELEAIKLYVESLKAQKELNQVQTALILAKEKLNQYLGNILPPDFSTIGRQLYKKTNIDENSILKIALQVHPRIKEKEARIEQANSNWSYVKWQRFPDFKLSGFSQKEIDGRNTGIGISLDIPLWNFKIQGNSRG